MYSMYAPWPFTAARFVASTPAAAAPCTLACALLLTYAPVLQACDLHMPDTMP